MKRGLFAGLLLCASPAAADEAGDMKAAATAFYAVALGQQGGAPDAASLSRYQPLASAALNNALKTVAAAETRWAARNKIVPPLIEGNVFVSLFEGATGFSIGACQMPGQCAVELVHDDRKAPPIRWSDKVVLVKEGTGWRVDDIVYGGKWAFANTGSLRQTLNIAVGMAGP